MYCTLCKVVSSALWVHVPASPTHPAHHCGGCAAAVVDGLGGATALPQWWTGWAGSLLADTNSYLSSSIAIVGRILCGMWHLYTVDLCDYTQLMRQVMVGTVLKSTYEPLIDSRKVT